MHIYFKNNDVYRESVEILCITNSFNKLTTDELEVGKEYVVYSIAYHPKSKHGVSYLADFGDSTYFLPKGVGENIYKNYEKIKHWKARYVHNGKDGIKIISRFFSTTLGKIIIIIIMVCW